jgi:hypothetical protein
MPKFTLSILFLSLSILSFAQTSVPEKIVEALDSFSFLRPQEKTYVQTDRNDYLAGESIWFKTYALLNQKPTILSKVIYVDLVDPTGKVTEKKMLKLTDGSANGVLDIRPDWAPGDYYLRCYTLWMLNFPAFIPEKRIRILNYAKPAREKPKLATNAKVNISFFPEGGNLVTGLKTIVAFKALDENGNPVSVNGEVLNNRNEKIASFKSIHDGMGTFELTPAANETYTAIAQFPGGKQRTVALPAAKNEGITLSVDNTNPGKTFIKVERSEKNKDKYNNLLVTAQINYQVAYMGKLNIDEGLDAAAINKKTLPPGIMQITVLTENGQPLAERIVFVANHSISNSLLTPQAVSLEKRKKNSISFDAGEFLNLLAAVAVTNANSETPGYHDGILSSLLLSGDIRGNINEPGYYFKDKDPVTLQHLDLVMMINGWRRYNLEEIMANKWPPLHYPFETSLSITGKVLQSNGRSALKAGKINLMIKGEDSTNIMSEAKTNENSVFVANDIEFKKAATVFYQGTNINSPEAIVTVKIDSTYFDTLQLSTLNTNIIASSASPAPYLVELLNEKQKKDTSFGKTLSEVVVRSRKRSEVDSLNTAYASDIFYGSDQTLALNQNINYIDIWQFLRMAVPGIAINQTDTGIQVNFTRYQGVDMFSENASNSGVQFFLNEVAVNVSLIDGLDPSDVAMVKIFKGVTGIALGADRGAIAVYTTKGKSGRDWRQKGFDFYKRSGYASGREFYEMDYSKLKPESISSDIRTTLYWNPEINIKDGKAIIEFYNDDVCKKFKVVIEGMDKNGKLLHAEKEIE